MKQRTAVGPCGLLTFVEIDLISLMCLLSLLLNADEDQSLPNAHCARVQAEERTKQRTTVAYRRTDEHRSAREKRSDRTRDRMDDVNRKAIMPRGSIL